MRHQLRCDNKMHGIVVADGVIEFKCDSRFCGAAPGIIVLHRFDIASGKMIETHKYKNPNGGKRNGTYVDPASVRPA